MMGDQESELSEEESNQRFVWDEDDLQLEDGETSQKTPKTKLAQLLQQRWEPQPKQPPPQIPPE